MRDKGLYLSLIKRLISNIDTYIKSPKALSTNLFIFFLFILGNLIFFNPQKWSHAYIGLNQFGDAEFWWNGAIHLSQGIIENNPGKGFRPGYFLISAPFLEIFNFNFNNYYVLLLNVFLLSVTFLYTSAKPYFGSITTAFICFTIAFSPYNVEWIATSTTDGTGLILNIFAFSFLLRFLKEYKVFNLILFSFFFFLNHFTRPLLAPFLGLFFLYFIFNRQLPLSYYRKICLILLMFLCFLIPTQIWKTIQFHFVGESSLSQNDASAFYAASDPSVQDWTPGMFKKIEESARKRLSINPLHPISTIELNKEFWNQTIQNYKVHWHYHLLRSKYHLKALLRDDLDQLSIRKKLPIRKLLLLSLIIFLIFCNFTKKNFIVNSAAICIILFFPKHFWTLSLYFLISSIRLKESKIKSPYWTILLFWLAGAFSLWLVGGTSSSGSPHINATSLSNLGYRLYSQFYFITSFIFYLPWIEKLNKAKISINFTYKLKEYLSRTSSLIVFTKYSILLQPLLIISLLITYFYGSYKIIRLSLFRKSQEIISFPDNLSTLRELKIQNLFLNENDTPILTGMFSQFYWNLNKRTRNLVLFYKQSYLSPVEMHPYSNNLELSSINQSNTFKHTQGLILYRNIKSNPISDYSNIPNANNYPHIIGFIPFLKNASVFQTENLIQFPLEMSINELISNNILLLDKNVNFKININQNTSLKTLIIEELSKSKELNLSLDLKRVIEPKELNFTSYYKLNIRSKLRTLMKNTNGEFNYKIYLNSNLEKDSIKITSEDTSNPIELIEVSLICKNLLPSN